MQDLCLSFTDEAQSLPILYTIVPDSSEMIPNYQNISVIGVVYERPQYHHPLTMFLYRFQHLIGVLIFGY